MSALDQQLRKEFMLKEIDLIQDIIKRMASNSFMIKGWTVTLVVATLILNGQKLHLLLAYIPLIVFWFLDAYFLRLERMYRKLYDWVVKNRLNSDDHLFNLNPYRFKNEVSWTIEVMFSVTLGWFYGSIAVLAGVYGIIKTLVK